MGTCLPPVANYRMGPTVLGHTNINTSISFACLQVRVRHIHLYPLYDKSAHWESQRHRLVQAYRHPTELTNPRLQV